MSGQFEQKASSFTDQFEEKASALSGQFEQRTSALSGELDDKAATLASQLVESEGKVKDFSAYIARLESRLEQTEKEKLESFGKALDAFDVQLRGKLSSAAHRGETLEGEVFARLTARIQEDEAAIAKSIQIIENRLADYQGDVEYRVKSLEESSHDVDALRASLSQSMEKIAAGVRTEMKGMGAELIAGWTAEIAGATVAREQLRAGIAELESGLTSLKAQAYQDVEKKLSVFEDEFLVDLRARSAVMQEKLQAWQAEIEARAAAFETDVKERIGAADGSIQTLRETIRGEMEKVKKDASLVFEKDITGVRDTMEAGTRKMHREIEARLKELAIELDAGRKEIAELFDAARADVKTWEGRSRQQLAEAELGIAEKISSLSGEASSSIGAIRDGFAAQREDILVSINEDRSALRTELSAMESRTAAFENELKERIAAADQSIQALGESMRVTMEQAKKDASLAFEKDLAGVREATEAGTRRMQREIEARIKEIEAGRKEVTDLLQASREEAAAWETRAREELTDTGQGIADQIAALSGEAASSIWRDPRRICRAARQSPGGDERGARRAPRRDLRGGRVHRGPQDGAYKGDRRLDGDPPRAARRFPGGKPETHARRPDRRRGPHQGAQAAAHGDTGEVRVPAGKAFREDRRELPGPVHQHRGDRQAGEGLPLPDEAVRARRFDEVRAGRHHRGHEEGDGKAERGPRRHHGAGRAACPHEEARRGGLGQDDAFPCGEAAHRRHGRRVQEGHRPLKGRGPQDRHPLVQQ